MRSARRTLEETGVSSVLEISRAVGLVRLVGWVRLVALGGWMLVMPFNRQQNHMLFGFSLWAHFCWRNFSGILGGKSDLIGRPMGKSLPTTGNQPCSFTIGSYRNEDLPLTFL